jgi:hypothetical protein
MATPEEIERRVEEKDAPRTARRSAAAKRVSELAQRRAAIVEQLEDIERELGDVLVDAHDVIDVDELARFTDVKAADLTRWLEAGRTARTKRKKPAGAAAGAKNDTSRRSSAAKAPTRTPVRTPTADQESALPESAATRDGAADASARVPAEVP